MINKISNTIATTLLIATLTSCDKDFNTMGAETLNENNIGFLSGEDKSDMIEEIKTTGFNFIQSNNLPINQLGVFEDALGKATASFVTQLQLATENPSVNNTAVLDSVVLSVPYFSTKIATNSLGTSTYRLDSIYSTNKEYYNQKTDKSFDNSKLKPFKLEIYRNGFQLNDFDLNDPTKKAKYYSNQYNILDYTIGNRLNDNTTNGKYTDDTFIPSNKEYIQPMLDEKNLTLLNNDLANNLNNIKARMSPTMRIHLNKTAFKEDILDKINQGLLANNSTFKNYYKGLVFKATPIDNSGTLLSLDFKKGDITLYYKQNKQNSTEKELKTIKLAIQGNAVNLLQHEKSASYQANLETTNTTDVYLKGGAGSLLELKLKQELFDTFKTNKALINDASLYFTVKPEFINALGTNKAINYLTPLRLYLYNLDKNIPIADLTFDTTKNDAFPKKNKFIYGGILTKINNKYMYRIRITDHLNQILQNSNGQYNNCRLALAISDDMTPSLANLYPMQETNKILFPQGSAISPLGVILGGKTGENKILLKISYTKPN